MATGEATAAAVSPARAGRRGVAERGYARLGPRFPRVVTFVIPQLALLNVLVGVPTIALFVHMSLAQFARLLIVGLVAMFFYNLAVAAMPAAVASIRPCPSRPTRSYHAGAPGSDDGAL